jgi:hypothetical protein
MLSLALPSKKEAVAVTRKDSMHVRFWLGLCAALVFAGQILAIQAAAAADDDELCADDKVTVAERIAACNRQLAAKPTGNDLAIIYNNRGIAYRRQNDLDRAYATIPRRSGLIRTTTRPITTAACCGPRATIRPRHSPITARRSGSIRNSPMPTTIAA